MSNYKDYQKKNRNLTDPPGNKTSPLEISVLSVFGSSPETWYTGQDDYLKVGQKKLAQARKYLSLIFGAYESGFVELRTWRQNQPSPDQRWYSISDPGWKDKLVARAFDEEALGKNVFVGVLPRSSESGYQNSVKEAAVLWADIDFKNTNLEEAKKLGIDAFDIIVKSGGGLHLYQLIEKPVPLTGDLREKFKQRHQKLLSRIKSDPVQNFDRILRLPGTTNYKPERTINGVQPKVELVKWPGQKTVVKPIYQQGSLLEVEQVDKSVEQKEAGLKEAFG